MSDSSDSVQQAATEHNEPPRPTSIFVVHPIWGARAVMFVLRLMVLNVQLFFRYAVLFWCVKLIYMHGRFSPLLIALFYGWLYSVLFFIALVTYLPRYYELDGRVSRVLRGYKQYLENENSQNIWTKMFGPFVRSYVWVDESLGDYFQRIFNGIDYLQRAWNELTSLVLGHWFVSGVLYFLVFDNSKVLYFVVISVIVWLVLWLFKAMGRASVKCFCCCDVEPGIVTFVKSLHATTIAWFHWVVTSSI